MKFVESGPRDEEARGALDALEFDLQKAVLKIQIVQLVFKNLIQNPRWFPASPYPLSLEDGEAHKNFHKFG